MISTLKASRVYVFYYPKEQLSQWLPGAKGRTYQKFYIKIDDYLFEKKQKNKVASKTVEHTVLATASAVLSRTIEAVAVTYSRSNVQRCLQFFSGDVLQDEQDYKDYLATVLQDYAGSRIRRTRLLFRYDPHNKTNIHVYIDNIPNIVLLAKTRQGWHFACYFQGTLNAKMGVDSSGLIVSLTNRRCYRCREGQRAVNYDKLYLIFGNSEVRVKADECRVLSNFGVNNGVYKAEGDRVGDLLGEGGSREVELEGFEVHQIVYFS